MSCKKLKQKQNDENICPISRKRLKPVVKDRIVSATKKPINNESPSLPSLKHTEFGDGMGLSSLDSEESSSSASVVCFTLSTSPDENSNEATPNTNAPKLSHLELSAIRSIDNNLNGSSEFSKTFEESNDETIKNINNRDTPLRLDKGDNMLQLNNWELNNSESNLFLVPYSMSSDRNGRSPLSTVIYNTSYRNASPLSENKSVYSNQNSTPVDQQFLLTSTLPSTSKQAALLRQQSLNENGSTQNYEHNQRLEDEFFLYRKPKENDSLNIDYFHFLSDEMILQIFKWLPKKTLLRCASVSERFRCCACDESLWARLDLGARSLRSGALDNVLSRGVIILRLAQTMLNEPVFCNPLHINIEVKLQYLDLSMSSISKRSLHYLLSRCRFLKKLSLEHVPINDVICKEIANNTNLEALNLSMCTGLQPWSVRNMFTSLTSLCSLNISWTNLSVDAITSIVTNITPNLIRLNISGCRKTIFDSHIATLAKRCHQLLELDLSDCNALTAQSISSINQFKMLEYLSLSRCYLIPVPALLDLKNLITLTYLDIFSVLSDSAMEMLQQNFPTLGINKYIHSSVARPTVGTRRTSIWGLRTRD